MSTSPHCCSVTLIVLGDDLEPDLVTSALGWSPNKSWRRGERKNFVRADGTKRVFDSVYEWGGWKLFSSDEERELSLREQVAAWLERLRGKAAAFKVLQQHGCEARLDCYTNTAEYLEFSAEALSELAGLPLGLCLKFDAISSEPDSAFEPPSNL